MVAIFQLAREFDWWTWLCPTCLERWLAKGWQIRARKDPPHELTCDECKKNDEQGANDGPRV